jgi:uncharacterized damage-inducible protein DinB
LKVISGYASRRRVTTRVRTLGPDAKLDNVPFSDRNRTVDYKSTDGTPRSQPLWHLLQHVVNHATHHRSEVATMVTMIKGSPASTDMVLYYRQGKSPS